MDEDAAKAAEFETRVTWGGRRWVMLLTNGVPSVTFDEDGAPVTITGRWTGRRLRDLHPIPREIQRHFEGLLDAVFNGGAIEIQVVDEEENANARRAG